MRQPKGSAMLKHESDDNESSSSSSSSSSNENENKCSTHRNDKKKHKKKKTKHSDEISDEKKLEKLIKMFPDRKGDEVKHAWTKSKFNSKKAIDLLLKEKENKNRHLGSGCESEKECSGYLI